ncbi:unnamed protein product [Tilletia caries]|uniref:Uncharacterized protein n=1 Tax=Tilletia caries TaxID=13290 RepID=A0A177VEL0_9BASI|nr:hypothetical protein CF336_g842 [Tilletia laevis]KAE8208039.1 hypothetical protein CF335_g716 [Tilletia laevis]KAE8265354.1 hypothetical protein A4X03_0g317 [Tilletia caries]CAD6884870.1 unnamed protein product [Tilletia caries]CAD7064205.1 unnamed protein product [Tilletia caries]
MNNALSSPFAFQQQQQQHQHQHQHQPATMTASTFGAISNSNALSTANSMAIHITTPSRKRKSSDDHHHHDHEHNSDAQLHQQSRPCPSRKLTAPRSAIGNPTLAQWVDLDPAQNQTTLASLGLMPCNYQGNANLFAYGATPAQSSSSDFNYASTCAGTPAMTGSPSSLFSEIQGMPPTPSDSHILLPSAQPSAFHRDSSSNLNHAFTNANGNGSSYFGSEKQRTSSTSSHASRSFGILEPQLGISGADLAMDGSAVEQPSSHGPWCKSIPQLSVRADGTGSELWALCRDCGAFDKVNPRASTSQTMAYSP